MPPRMKPRSKRLKSASQDKYIDSNELVKNSLFAAVSNVVEQKALCARKIASSFRNN